ncbi:MAG: hypothetical protein PVF84_07715 [Desulfuromonadales bacterium]|jgi:hypothetical protein
MKKAIVCFLMLATSIVGISAQAFSENCFEASGEVSTENITTTLQIGTIDLTLKDQTGNSVFSDSGFLAGNITGTDGIGTTFLSHKAKFDAGNQFVTSGDKAELAYPYVRRTTEDGTPCSFWVHETISTITKGARFFKDVISAEVYADGYISNCPDENTNYFVLTGNICTE